LKELEAKYADVQKSPSAKPAVASANKKVKSASSNKEGGFSFSQIMKLMENADIGLDHGRWKGVPFKITKNGGDWFLVQQKNLD
tara:strand:+ start:1096 stop:1347 length:252 start_codon:yes stop_codon:yes gene_type:complete